jgi:hypothetical protein
MIESDQIPGEINFVIEFVDAFKNGAIFLLAFPQHLSNPLELARFCF